MPALLAYDTDPVPLARGLLQGQLQQGLAAIRAMRRARLELDDAKSAPLRVPELSTLDYAQLQEQERLQCPPLLLVASALAPETIATLLTDDLPLKVLLLSDGADSRLDGQSPAHVDAVGLIALATRRPCFVAQSSIAFPEQLFEALSGAMRHPGAALVRIHAPSPLLHGFDSADTLKRAREAVDARVWPLFVLRPGDGDSSLRERLSLSHNPASGNGSIVDKTPVAPLNWLRGEQRFAHHFDGPGTDAQPAAPSPSAAALSFARERQRAWEVLQEIAGVSRQVSTAALEQARGELDARHERALAELARQYERQLELQQQQHASATATYVRDRLLALAGYGAPAEGKR